MIRIVSSVIAGATKPHQLEANMKARPITPEPGLSLLYPGS